MSKFFQLAVVALSLLVMLPFVLLGNAAYWVYVYVCFGWSTGEMAHDWFVSGLGEGYD